MITMKKLTKILAAVMAVAMLAAFTDVPKSHWSYSYVEKAYKLKIVRGVSEKKFNPDMNISKQEIGQLLMNVYVLSNTVPQDVYDNCVSESAVTLKQAKVDEWAYPVISYGLVNGFWQLSDFQAPVEGKSGGASIITREMMARWICNTFSLKTFGLRVISYADKEDIDPVYYPYVDSLYRFGIMQGSDVGFLAKEGMTRAQAATVAMNLYEKDRTSTLEKNALVYESGKITSIEKQYKSFVIGKKILQIADDAKILLNGVSVSFDEIAKLNDKNASVSIYLSGDNTQSVIVQTKPVAIVGSLDSQIQKDGYKVVSITTDGVTADYIINTNTEVLSTLTTGNTVTFISDGIYLLEIQ